MILAGCMYVELNCDYEQYIPSLDLFNLSISHLRAGVTTLTVEFKSVSSINGDKMGPQ